MTHKPTHTQSLKVAAPYYGALSHPTRGLSNLYFLLDINPAEKKVAHMHVSVWNPSDSDGLGSWLKRKGVQTLLCSAIENCHHHELQETGIQIESLAGNDILHEIKNWAKNVGAEILGPAVPATTIN